MKEIQAMYPSEDGNAEKRDQIIHYIRQLLEGVDEKKNPEKLTLGQGAEQDDRFYENLSERAEIPLNRQSIEKVIEELTELAEGHRFVNSRYVANAAPLPNIPSILGNLTMVLLNGNNLWDVEGSAAAAAEVKITSMLSKLVGYDPSESGGYTTWGGQGAVFQSLRLAIARRFPDSNKTGLPGKLYCFCSELSHYSLYKAVEATGIGTDHLIRVETKEDHSMDIEDLKHKMNAVIKQGGIPVYVLASTGTTDTFGIDSVASIKNATEEMERLYGLDPVYIHADSAMGGMYTFFNAYDFDANPLCFDKDTAVVLRDYQTKFRQLSLADSMVFDFHKLGQTPYTSSLFLIKDKRLLGAVDLEHDETPYVGNRSYGSYHTGYTLECSRMGSSLAIYASLTGMGIEGYQKVLGNYITVNLAFRKELSEKVPCAVMTNAPSPVTTFRIYPERVSWGDERCGKMTAAELDEVNGFNAEFADYIGHRREEFYFGSTSKQRLVPACDSDERTAVYAHKFFAISPYTTLEKVEEYVDFLAGSVEMFKKEYMHTV
ncbi:pyridoxal-dependent decarboxylase [Halobacillus sp. BAB-2008]|uniref:pyridoxal phosphate-dependent decarboxylase family protein n=1 Tax=Halobacillus sp. BAB-2008 TaxID=1246484 RepID=UPI0002A4D149|nr:pyridoxal-dependent decarboxylase [Halobacillus sp. BAB-2008]ELK48181.1 2,4-diaminobutyrate decarboxylase [Halobacillus sp. BAB-2008]